MAGWAVALLLGSAMGASADTVWVDDVIRVGGETNVLLGQVEAVEVVPGGGIYVLDGFAHRVHAFSRDGDLLWSRGREGDGPGEYRSPVGLTRAVDGTLWVIDPGTQRATLLDQGGGLVGIRRVPSGFTLSPWPGRFDTDGTFYHYLDAAAGTYEFQMGAFGSDMELLEVRRPPESPDDEQFFEGRTERGSEMRARVPYTPRFSWRLDSRGQFVSNWSAEPTFTRGGPTPRVQRIPETAAPRVTSTERRAVGDMLDGFVRRGGRLDLSRVPDRKPSIAFFVLDEADRIWAAQSAHEGASSTVFDVLGVDGTHLGTIAVRARVGAHPYPVIRDGWMVGVEVGPLGTQTGVIARLPSTIR